MTRFIRLLRAPTPDDVGVLAIHSERRSYFYVFREIACDIGGRGFAMHRLGLGPLYHVRVGASAECSCECLGFLSRGHCKHIRGLLALVGHRLI